MTPEGDMKRLGLLCDGLADFGRIGDDLGVWLGLRARGPGPLASFPIFDFANGQDAVGKQRGQLSFAIDGALFGEAVLGKGFLDFCEGHGLCRFCFGLGREACFTGGLLGLGFFGHDSHFELEKLTYSPKIRNEDHSRSGSGASYVAVGC